MNSCGVLHLGKVHFKALALGSDSEFYLISQWPKLFHYGETGINLLLKCLCFCTFLNQSSQG